MRNSHTATQKSGGRWVTRRTGLAGLVSVLTMALVTLVNPAPASAASCDGTYLIAGQSASNGNPMFQTIHTLNYPNPSGEFTMPTSGQFRFVATAGTVRPRGLAIYSFFKDLPTGEAVLVARVSKRAGDNGVVRQEPDVRDVDVFANPGDRLRVQGFWETNGFCTPNRVLDSTLGWINFV